MYLDMLEQAVSALRAGTTPQLERPLAASSEVELHVPALLPESYVPDVQLRLSLYQRIAAAEPGELEDMHGELVDRFGPLPEPAGNLLRLAALRWRARGLGLRRLDLGPQGGSVQFADGHKVDARVVIRLLQKEAREFRMDGPTRLRITRALATPAARCDYAAQLLDRLAAPG
jgi:transcription-repair coupling factor (superfamily II helicase)